jgi:hypothetical protein
MSRTAALQTLHRFGDRPFRVRDAERAGAARYDLYRLRDNDQLIELARGIYQLASAQPSSTVDFATVCARVPEAIIALNSALAYW